jgi:hypothetical protein
MQVKHIKLILLVSFFFFAISFKDIELTKAEEYPFGVYGCEFEHWSIDRDSGYQQVAECGFNRVVVGIDSTCIDLSSIKKAGLKAYFNQQYLGIPQGYSSGQYTKWEAEGTVIAGHSLQPHGGYDSSGVMIWRANNPGDERGFIITGPDYYQCAELQVWWYLPSKASFRMKINDNSGSDTVAIISVVIQDSIGVWHYVSDTLFSNNFPSTVDTNFTISYSLANYENWVLGKVEFKIYWFKTRDLYVDNVAVFDTLIGERIVSKTDSVATSIKNYAQHFKDSTQVVGFLLADEPPTIDRFYPYRFVDSLLNIISSEKRGITAYAENLSDVSPPRAKYFIEISKPYVFMNDYYPLSVWSAGLSFQGKLDRLCEILDTLRRETILAQKEFYYISQAFGDSPLWIYPTPNEMKCFINLGLSYKSDGIVLFMYKDAGNGIGLVDTLFNPRENWYAVQSVAPKVKLIGSILRDLNWEGTCLDSSNNSFDLVGCGGGYLDSIRSPGHEPHWVQVGFIENQSGDTSYLMLVNRECLETEGANYDVFVTKTGGPYQIRDMYTDSIVDQVSGTGDHFTIYLGPGEGKLLRLESTGHGTTLFKPPVNYAGVPYYISDIFAGDLDNDGDADLAVANYYYKFSYSHAVTIFKNRGDGAFDTTRSYFPGRCPVSLFATDYDKDGDKDLAVANGDPCSDTVSIFKNNGTGVFSYLWSYGTYRSPEDLFSADFDKDGNYDIVASLHDFSDSVVILWGQGNGWFDPAVYYYSGGHFRPHILAADFNGDTYPDLAISNQTGGNLCILINDHNRSFQYPVCHSIGNYPIAICGADLDNDGDCDLVVANEGESYQHLDPSISIFKNNGNGTFYLANNYVVSGIDHIVTADFDLDGDFDLAFTSDTSESLFVWLNAGNGTFQPAEAHFVGGWWDPLVACDLNGDGAPDLAVGRGGDFNLRDVAILINLSTNFPPNPFSLISPPDKDTILPTNSYAYVNFDWQETFDPEGDSVWYALYISRSPSFRPESTTIHANLLQAHYSDSLQAGTYFWKVKASDKWGAPRWSNQTWSLCTYICGDVTGDGSVDASDLIFVLNYLFAHGPVLPWPAGDVNSDGTVDASDLIYLLNYLFAHGPEPACIY